MQQLTGTTELAAERAALVALLRLQPDKLTWPEITTEVVEIGSAMAVWERHVPATLLGSADEELSWRRPPTSSSGRARGTRS